MTSRDIAAATRQRLCVRIGAWFVLSVLVFYGLLAALDTSATWLVWLNFAAVIAVGVVIYQVALRRSFAAREKVRLL